jgi:two-component system CheB/CheR fusion protein
VTDRDFLIVGLGASAGGVQAFRSFFEHVPADSGLAFVAILHLSPEHESHLADVLQTVTSISVQAVDRDRVRVVPNHAYVVSPRVSLAMSDGWLVPSPAVRVEERRAPVDIFFRTLAEAHGALAGCVVMSGSGADGSMGLKRIKEQGGLCLAQDPGEADHGDMPRSAISTGLVDDVLPAAAMPARLIAYFQSLRRRPPVADAAPRDASDEQALHAIFTELRARTGHDFSNYKRATVLRRIERRLGVRQIDDLAGYAQYLGQHHDEAQALLKDLLISVTNFFRDPAAFERLGRR